MDDVLLRQIREDDLDALTRFVLDAESMGEFQWFGFKDPHALRRRWEEDGWIGGDHSQLVVDRGGELTGFVGWKDRTYGIGRALVYEIGIALRPEFRGQGLGTAAQRLLVAYRHLHTPVHRLEAFTEVDNVGEQRALEKAGFEREGVMRDVIFRGGQWRSSCVYSLIRAS